DSNGLIDSKGTPDTAGNPQISVSAHNPGQNDHTYDFGFYKDIPPTPTLVPPTPTTIPTIAPTPTLVPPTPTTLPTTPPTPTVAPTTPPAPTPTATPPPARTVTFWLQELDACKTALPGAAFTLTGGGLNMDI